MVQSCIEFYPIWYASTSAKNDSPLFCVAGVLSCYLYASTSSKPIMPGIWGPFTNMLDDSFKNSVYEGGSSCSRKLIEHHFTLYFVSTNIPHNNWNLLFKGIEQAITVIEEGTKIAFTSKPNTNLHMVTRKEIKHHILILICLVGSLERKQMFHLQILSINMSVFLNSLHSKPKKWLKL